MNMLLLDPGDLSGLVLSGSSAAQAPLAPGMSELSGAHVELTDRRRVEHLRKVLKVSIGDTIRAGVRGGQLLDGIVTALSAESVTLALRPAARSQPPALPVRLALALPRPPTLQKCLHAATTMGVKHITLFHAARVEKSYWTSHALREEELNDTIGLALEQCGDTIAPAIEVQRSLTRFVREVLGARASGSTLWFAHPGEAMSENERSHPEDVILVGPEGGFVDWEIQLFVDAGARPLALGPRPLRVEVACTALLARFGSLARGG